MPCSKCLRPESEAWGRSWVEIDLAAFRRNTERVAATLPPGGRLVISAKKDAYGHGMVATLGAVEDLPALVGKIAKESGFGIQDSGQA
jgi:alanine racemase